MGDPVLQVEGELGPFGIEGRRLRVARRLAPGVTVLRGASGLGKSSLLRALAGLASPFIGTVRFGEELWCEGAVHRVGAAERALGVVLQSGLLLPHLTVLENVALSGRSEVSPEGASDWLGRVGGSALAERPVATLSGGERQRVALARALCRPARALLLDEPLSALDAPSRALLERLVLEEVAARSLPTLWVSHQSVVGAGSEWWLGEGADTDRADIAAPDVP